MGFQGRRKPTSRPVQPAPGGRRQAQLGIRRYTKLDTHAIMNVNKNTDWNDVIMTKIDLRPSGVALHFIKHKANTGEINGLQRHNERQPGGRHGNKNIDDTRTKDNIFLIRDDRKLNERIEDTIAEKRNGGLKGVRQNAVRMVEGTVQLSGKVLDEPEERQVELLKDSFEYLQDVFGKDNFVSAVIHLDETTPHLHFDFVPIEDGRLTAKTIISPNRLRKYQADFLKHLQDNYADLNFQRGKGEYNGLTFDAFKRLKDEEAKVEKEQDDREAALDDREDNLDDREDNLVQTEVEAFKNAQIVMDTIKKQKDKEKELNDREEKVKGLEEKAKQLDDREKKVKDREDDVERRERSLELREADLDKKDRDADKKLAEAAKTAQEADEKDKGADKKLADAEAKDKGADKKLADAEAKDKGADEKLSKYDKLMKQLNLDKEAFEQAKQVAKQQIKDWRDRCLQEIENKRNEVQQEITNRWNKLQRAWSRVVHKVENGALRTEPVKKIVEKYDPLEYDKTDEFTDGLNALADSADNNNQMGM